jgi:hypothetical protein
MTKATESKWRALIAAQARSGMTVRAFAEARGIVTATMYWWRARLRRGANAELVPVEIVDNAIDTRRRDATPCSFELQVDASTTLRIQAGFDEAELRRLLRVLRC